MRIFIYSRKSKWTGRGESVENQLVMCREYVENYIEDADQAEILEFEDEGYSGKDTKRPQFRKMMERIDQGECDYLVCYKLDRLGRNIADIANLVEKLDKKNIFFISIKERFDTTTPIGKAMLYFAGVLAQMEREQIAERVRDNMILLARKGRWLGGNTPLGFRAQSEAKVTVSGKRKTSFRLVPDEEELKTVRFIFSEYLEKQSLTGISDYFLTHNILTKRGKKYTVITIRDILTNPVYCTADQEGYDYFWNLGCQVCMEEEEADGQYGLISYGKTSSAEYKSKDTEPEKWIIARGRHEGIISGKDFARAQLLLKNNKGKGDGWRKPHNSVALLSGLLYCSCGHAMRPKYYDARQVSEKGERRFSYLCEYKDATHGKKCAAENVQGNTLDDLVCRDLLSYMDENASVPAMLEKIKNAMDDTRGETENAADVLEEEIRKRKTEIQNLVGALARSSGSEAFVCEIEGQVQKLNEACAALEKEKAVQQEKGQSVRNDALQPAILAEQLSSFKNCFDTLSVPEKREYLRLILEKVIWDGEVAHIFLQ
ncbi:MAG: recombinase family protein [Lachnospiraceae bacterium]|nr:recombinase family protein [Lachnospiraceae bacterium]